MIITQPNLLRKYYILPSITNMKTLILFLLATFVATSQASSLNPIHLLRPRSGAGGRPVSGLNCLSWQLAVETNNLRSWKVVPDECENYVGHYMLGNQYRKDCNFVASTAYKYAKSLELKGDGKDIWIFDIDETTLSNLPYYAQPKVAFGASEYNETAFEEWQLEGRAPAVPGSLKLYKKLVKLGFKIVFLTGKYEHLRDVTEMNLKKAGYRTWEKLLLKQPSEEGITSVAYKSQKREKLVAEGYRILGNMGDQWSDLLGSCTGQRTFKVPDPMYYIS